MSWRLAVIALLALVVIGGFLWYERSRPGARIVSLVAALAALAIAGRLLFAPVPNVLATTDIALITGYALGGAPGFAVGALAAPVSNIWLGQGPWTAWQMAAWGLAGLAGAAAATLSGRRLGRFGLAAICGLAGLAYGALLDLSVMVTYGGEQSLDRYLALAARGAPFNLAHAAGNFAIALAAGPALVRMISRYRTRLEFTWRPASAATLGLVLAGFASAFSPALSEPPLAEAKASPLAYLAAAQNSDGGFAAAPGQPSSPAMTGWVMLGLEGGGRNPLDVRRSGRSAVDYLRANVGRLGSTGDLERTVLALAGAGLDPSSFAGENLVGRLRDKLDGDGSIDGQVNLTAFYVLAMSAAGAGPGELGRPARWLREAQADDGGWGIQPRAPSEADSTAGALQALAAAGQLGRASEQGVRYLRRSQDAGGGWALAGSGVVNAQSTSWAVQGLAAAGAGGRPLAEAQRYLGRAQAADGHYRYSSSSDQTPVWVTAQALLAARKAAFPLAAVPRAPERAAQPAPAQQSAGAPASPPALQGEAATPKGEARAPARERSRARQGRAERRRAGATSSPASTSDVAAAAAATAADAPAASAAAAESPPAASAEAESGSDLAPWVAGGLAGLALALGAGFLWYRDRLP